MMEFLAMGGYWPYVWGSYLVMAGLMAVEMVQVRFRRRSLMGWIRRMARIRAQEEKQ